MVLYFRKTDIIKWMGFLYVYDISLSVSQGMLVSIQEKIHAEGAADSHIFTVLTKQPLCTFSLQI